MADTITSHYHWVKPEISGSPTTWGVKLNADLDLIDSQLFATDAKADSFVGEIKMYAGTTLPPKWKWCDGAVYNNTDVPLLAPIIGTLYGGVAGVSCAVPDLRQRFPVGSQVGVLTAGVMGGEATHTLTAAEMPSHTHTPTVTDPGHFHTMAHNLAPGTAFGSFATTGTINQLQDITEDTDVSTTGITVANATVGGGGSHNNLPPYICINFIIKYA